MRLLRVWLSSLVIPILLVGFVFSAAEAQVPDLSIWVGKWFYTTQKNLGVSVYGLQMSNYSNTGTYYVKFTGWDSLSGQLTFLSYPTDDYVPKEISISIMAGTMLDFLCWGYFDKGEEGFSGVVWRIQGKMSKGELKSGTIKSLGGFFWDKATYIDQYQAGEIVIIGKLIPESKVPPEIR
jgi:hypothetical protein